MIDYVRGRRDLDERFIRTIGNPEVRRYNGTTGKYVVITPNAGSIGVTQNAANTPCGSWICRDTNGNATTTLITNAFVEGFLDPYLSKLS